MERLFDQGSWIMSMHETKDIVKCNIPNDTGPRWSLKTRRSMDISPIFLEGIGIVSGNGLKLGGIFVILTPISQTLCFILGMYRIQSLLLG